MTDAVRPQIYLITPPAVAISQFGDQLAGVLDQTEVACVRMALSGQDEETVLRVGDALREITHARDVALVIETHVMMVQRLGLDGVHLSDGARSIGKARATLGSDAIIGAYCGQLRHDGMNAAEAGADYVSFGPVTSSGLGDGEIAETDLFSWWSEFIEIPVVAEGNLDEDSLVKLASVTDFMAFRSEVWGSDDPAETLKNIARLIS